MGQCGFAFSHFTVKILKRSQVRRPASQLDLMGGQEEADGRSKGGQPNEPILQGPAIGHQPQRPFAPPEFDGVEPVPLLVPELDPVEAGALGWFNVEAKFPELRPF